MRVVIVDDHELARASLRTLLMGARGLEVVGEAASGREAVAVCLRLEPDLVLIDVELGDMDGFAVTQEIREALPGTRVLVMSLKDGSQYPVEARRVGAAGYLLKGSSRKELLRAVRGARYTAVAYNGPCVGASLPDPRN
jgi:DNA-binding NarL/FixJ family response regulator